jgi:oxygen-independent coproporphyrinogen-3 oxidase
VQQLNDDVLRASGRVHLVRDVERAFADIRLVGFPVVNVDLIAGLVDETDASFRASLDRIIELAPDSVTIYPLEIPLNTPLWRALRDGEVAVRPASWDVKRARLRDGWARLEDAGYTMRSAYAAVRDPVRHRFDYQEMQYRGADLLGVGTSAFSHVGGFNQQNRASLADYLDRVAQGGLPLWRAYELSDAERLVREFVLQLKLGEVRREPFRARFGIDVVERLAEPIARLVRHGWLTVDDDAVTVTRDGLLRVDRLIPTFYLEQHRDVRYS